MWISWIYGDLRVAAALDLAGQDAFAGLGRSDSLLVCGRYALLPNGLDTFCTTVLWICAGLLSRALVWREAAAGMSGNTREARADVMRRASTRKVVLWAAVVARKRR